MALELPFNTDKQFADIKASAIKTIKNSFPIEGNKHKLVLTDVWVDDTLNTYDLASQKKAKLGGKSWAVPVYAGIDLIDKSSGKVINSVKRMKLIDLPKITPRASYIVDGNEYQVVNQLRLKPGVYTRIKNNGELESKVNLAKGVNFDVLLNQERGVFTVKIGTANIKLYPILRDLGISDQEMMAAWGDKLLESNQKASSGVMETEIKKLRAAIIKRPKLGNSREEAVQEVKEYLSNTVIDPKTTKMTMGQSFDKADVDLLLATSRRLLETARGEKEPDDRDSLVYKSLHSVEDFIGERLQLNETKIKQAIQNKLDRKFKISEILSKKIFDDPVKTMFTNTSISATTEQINPLHMYSGQLKLTIMGEGGIQNEQAVSTGARSVHPSEIGFVDPVHTPQSGQVGAVTRLAIGIQKDGNKIYTSVINTKTGAVERIDPIEFNDKVVAFPDQYTAQEIGKNKFKLKPLSNEIKVLKQENKPTTVKPSKVDYVLVDPKTMFSISTNLIPFLNSTQGNRALMSSAQYEQALALKYREKPLVQVDTGLGITAEQDVGNVLAHTSPVDGEVVKVDPEYIHIKDKSGKVEKIGIYHDFPLNQKTYLNAEPVVAVGDKVKKGDLLADNNYTKDGVLSMGTNLRVAYMPYKGYNFEDGIVISESAAKKLTSEHMHKISVQISEGGLVDKKKFAAYFPTLMTAKQSAKLDEDGVIKEGADVEYGDILISYMTKNMLTPERMMVQKLHRSLLKPYADRHEEWKYEFKGVVSQVVKTPKEVTVYIKTEEPATIGDKLSGRYGNKGIIASILPDGEMPHNKEGDHVEVILNPIGLPSRLNPGQILETAASKAAEKSGEPFTIRNFSPKSNYKQVEDFLKENKVVDKEILIDPEDGKELGSPIMVGKQFMLKLDHPVRKKFGARSRGAYTVDKQPSSASGSSGQSMDHLTLYAMLSHGAKNILRESATYKSEQNDEFWRALQLGQPLPAPKPTYAFGKFVDMMRASGVNVDKEGSKLNLSPMTDTYVDELSNGEIKNPLIVKGKNIQPEKGGLVDPEITGGLDGSNWSHFNLSEPIPNPMFENAIKTILHIKQNEYDGIIGGKLFVKPDGNINDDSSSGETGGRGIKALLEKIDVAKRLEQLHKDAEGARENQLDKLNKEIRYLKALQANGLKPSDYIMHKVPVIPPKFRPIYPMPDGSLNTSDANFLYRDSFLINQKLKELKKAPEAEKQDLRSSLYKSVKAIQGLGNPTTFKDYRGFTELIKGRSQPKSGYYQKKLISRRQDLSARSTIVPEPSLGVNQVGLPKKMAWTIYEPHIVRELVQRGYTPLEAQKQVKDQTPIAQKALEAATAKRPVLLNRSPTLHKFGIMAFNPTLTDGKTIKIHPLVVKGFNADFDGDTMSVHVPVTEKGRVEAFNMLPTNNIFNPATGDIMLMPQNEMILGLYLLTKPGKKINKTFKSIADAKKAMEDGTITINSIVKIGGKETTLGRAIVNGVLPEPIRDNDIFLDKKGLNNLLKEIAEKYKDKFGEVVDALKDLGNQHSFKTGFSVGMADIKPLENVRNKVVLKAQKAIGDRKTDDRVIKAFTAANDLYNKEMLKEMEKRDNALYHMSVSGAKGNASNLRQITTTPNLVQDHTGAVVPEPIFKSYSEGLDAAGYWSSMYGARAGTIGRSLQSAVPGYFSKRLVSSVMGNTITMEDCGTNKGIDEEIDSEDIFGRLLAAGNDARIGKKNDIVDNLLINKARKLKKDKLLVRSPLTCEAPEGTCAACFGKMADGEKLNVGDNVGTIAAQALSEPVMQMGMNAFHTGGVAGAGAGIAAVAQGYERIAQLLEMPEIVKGKSTLSTVDGKVSNIEANPAGGSFVYVGETKHFVPQGRAVIVKKGQEVKRGDQLSDGVAKPQEVLDLKGVDATRRYLTDELKKAYTQPIKKNIFEAVVKEMTNTTQVINPGDSTEFEFGDYAPLNKIESVNSSGGDIAHSPILKGINTLPLVSEDWMARLGTRDLAKTIREGASRAWSSDIHGTHPIPAYVYGAEFGQGTEGKY